MELLIPLVELGGRGSQKSACKVTGEPGSAAVLCPGDLPDPGIEPVSLMSPALAGGFFTSMLLEISGEITP